MPLVSPKHSVTASICDFNRRAAHTDTLSVHFSLSCEDRSNAHVISVGVLTPDLMIVHHSQEICSVKKKQKKNTKVGGQNKSRE